jgi:DNA-binding response OmpR family regulator
MARIIYAEDDELMGEIVRSTLAKDGHIVGVVADGKSALRAIAFKSPDLVILDCSMPELSGIQVLERMRLDQALYNMPVLMLTGRQSEKDVSLAAYAGADAYVKKPFDPEYLLFVASSLLEEGRAGGNM